MIINEIYINPNNVFSVELIKQPISSIECIINLEKEYILTQRGTIKNANEEFDVINETYEIMKEDIINSLKDLNAKNRLKDFFEYKFEDDDLKNYDVLKYILNEYNYIDIDAHKRRFNTVIETVVNQHFRKAVSNIEKKYELKHAHLQSTEYKLRILSNNNSRDIVVHSRLYNLHNITEFFNKIKNPVNIDDLRNYWYSKFERKIQI